MNSLENAAGALVETQRAARRKIRDSRTGISSWRN